jgi:polyphosphate kinase
MEIHYMKWLDMKKRSKPEPCDEMSAEGSKSRKKRDRSQRKRFVNRELSWLSFNDRVLQEAADPDVPLIERLKFLGIYSSNLEEFFSVRVGTLIRMDQASIKPGEFFGGTPKRVLKEIHEEVLRQRDKFDSLFAALLTELKNQGIHLVNEQELSPVQERFVQRYFLQEVRPRLVPIMLDSLPSFPYLKNLFIYLTVRLQRTGDAQATRYALIEVPADVLPRFVVLPREGELTYIILLDDVIRYGLKDVFSMFQFDTYEAYTIKLTRDAEIDIDDDVTKSFFEKISKSIRQRAFGHPVRFVYDRDMPSDLLDFILERAHLKGFENLISGGRYHNARDFMRFPNVGPKGLLYGKRSPIPHPDIVRHSSMFEAIREKDILLHYPYQSFDHIIDLLREAAIDPKVHSIKMTLYRLAKDSNIINALVNACHNGKRVSAVIELRARFDEEANIHWTKQLEAAHAHVIEGVPGLKVHSKLCLITRIEQDRPVHYCYVATGNFNETTAKVYSDHGLLTCNPILTKEVQKVFRFFDCNYKTTKFRHLLVSPFYTRKRFSKLIANEIANAKKGKEAYIIAKMNSLVDREKIEKLYAASCAGVKVKLIVRGICSLVPGIMGLSDNIEVVSILDRYLEHSRVFIFANDGDPLTFISSADWMIRNLDNRVEVTLPIYDKSIQQELRDFIDIQLRDNRKARIINQMQDNSYTKRGDEPVSRAQDDLYAHLKKKAAEKPRPDASPDTIGA